MRHLATTLAAVLAAAPAESRLGISPSLAERDAASPRAGGFAVRRDLRERGAGAGAGRAFPFAPEFLDATGTHAPVGNRNETAPADGGEEDRRRRDLEEAATFGEFEVRRELHEYRFGRTFPLNPDFLHSEAITTTTTTTTVPNIPTTQFATFGTVASQAGGGATGADETKAAVEKKKKKKTKKEKEAAADLTKQDKKKQKKMALEEEKVEDSTRRGRQLGNQVSEAIQNIIKLSAR